MNDCEPRLTLDPSAIRNHETLPALGLYSEGLQQVSRDPGKHAACIDECVGELVNQPATRYTFDPDGRLEESHVGDCTLIEAGSLIIVLPPEPFQRP